MMLSLKKKMVNIGVSFLMIGQVVLIQAQGQERPIYVIPVVHEQRGQGEESVGNRILDLALAIGSGCMASYTSTKLGDMAFDQLQQGGINASFDSLNRFLHDGRWVHFFERGLPYRAVRGVHDIFDVQGAAEQEALERFFNNGGYLHCAQAAALWITSFALELCLNRIARKASDKALAHISYWATWVALRSHGQDRGFNLSEFLRNHVPFLRNN